MAKVEHRTALALIMGAVLIGGCASGTAKAIRVARGGVHVIAVELDKKADAWAQQVDARIAFCKRQGLESKEARAQCMGVFGDGEGWEADFDALRQTYDLTADGLEQLEAAAARIDARLAGQKVDSR